MTSCVGKYDGIIESTTATPIPVKTAAANMIPPIERRVFDNPLNNFIEFFFVIQYEEKCYFQLTQSPFRSNKLVEITEEILFVQDHLYSS